MFRIRLKQLRESKGLSQYAFAQKMGVAQSTVGNWESGKREPNYSTLQKLADYFGVSTDYLLGGTNAPPAVTRADGNASAEGGARVSNPKQSPSEDEGAQRSSAIKEINEILSKVRPEKQEEALRFLRALIAADTQESHE